MIIENVDSWQINANELVDERENTKFIINLYNINFESYWLYYFLVQTKLLYSYSLKEVHIKNRNMIFYLALFKLIKKYWNKNKISSFIKLLSSRSNSNPLSKIVERYNWESLKSSPDLNTNKFNQLVVKVIICFYNRFKWFYWFP